VTGLLLGFAGDVEDLLPGGEGAFVTEALGDDVGHGGVHAGLASAFAGVVDDGVEVAFAGLVDVGAEVVAFGEALVEKLQGLLEFVLGAGKLVTEGHGRRVAGRGGDFQTLGRMRGPQISRICTEGGVA
jgi:hypothetical protein